ncbi:PadR family transcriptional regulator [Paeniglutamicibacter sp. NPDC091659]|uniref:PadR family transcriptional regulator n=1 Tax=Paeniglutamicibacter sp. NPDC091659 TaxID=3364389 RepID=UPI0037F17DB2
MESQPNTETESPSDTTWNSEWMRGLLPLFILVSLRDGPSYGYAIISKLSDHGISGVKGGTLYPLLSRQQEAGLVTTEWKPGDGGPGRKYFALTPSGSAEVERLRAEWTRFIRTAEKFIINDGKL